MTTRHHSCLQGIITLLLLAIILITGAYLLRDTAIRIDCTQEKLYTLSEVTQTTLHSLKQPVTVRFYYSRSIPQIPVSIKNFAQRIEDTLNEYQRLSNGNFQLEKLDPVPDTETEDTALLEGLSGQNGAPLGVDGNLYLGLSLRCDSHTAAIPVFQMEREAMLEYDITRALLEVLNPARRTIGILSSLPVGGKAGTGDKPTLRPPWHIITELQKEYNILPIPMTATELPPALDVLLIIHPKAISNELLRSIDAYIHRGGSMAAFLDPLCMAEIQERPKNPNSYVMLDAASSLTPLLKAWGVTFSADGVLLDPHSAATLRLTPNDPPQSFPYVLTLARANILKKDPATADISSLLFFSSGVFDVKQDTPLKATSLVISSGETQLVEPYATQRKPADIMKAFTPSSVEPRTLALRLTGTFPCAYPETSTLRAIPASVVLIGDADLLYDPFCIKTTRELDITSCQPINHNLAFAQNLIDNLSGDSRLYTIRARGFRPRPFDRIQTMAKSAENEYEKELNHLQEELEKVKKELYGIQNKTTDGKQILLTQEQKEALKQFRQQETITNRKIKQLRKRMRHDVNLLENRVILINLTLMPILVILTGITVAVMRKK